MSEAEQLPDEQVEDQIGDRHEEEQPQISQAQEQAQRNGHITRDEWIADGKDPDDWRSPKQFNEHGEMIGKMRQQDRALRDIQSTFDSRLENVNKLNQAMISQKQRELDGLIEMADKDGARAVQKEIDDLKTPAPAPQVQGKSSDVEDWESRNSWINDSTDPRTSYANDRYIAYRKEGKTDYEALQNVDADISKHFSKPQRSAPTPERGVSKPAGRREQKITMNDVPKSDVANFRGMFKSDEEFLQTYKDIKGN